MAIKKTSKNIKSSSTRKTKRPTEKKLKENLVEKKLSSVMDQTTTEKTSNSKKRKVNFPWWGMLAVLLILAFGTLLLYENNTDFRNNFGKLMNSTGLVQMPEKADQKIAEPEKFEMKLNIVYNKDNANMKQTIEQYIQNIERNLTNTKVSPKWIDKNEEEGKALIEKLQSKFLPIFTTDETIKQHPQYALFAPAVMQKNGEYQFQSEGMEYLTQPSTGDARVLGASPDKAKVVMIEYVSMTCGYCRAMHPILQNILNKYGTEVSLIIKHYDRGGVDSLLGQAIECAADQNRFDQMITALFNRQADLFGAMQSENAEEAIYNLIKGSASEAGANGETLLTCVKSNKYKSKVESHTKEGQEFGVMGTPSFFINQKFIGGAMEEAAFTKLIEEELNK